MLREKLSKFSAIKMTRASIFCRLFTNMASRLNFRKKCLEQAANTPDTITEKDLEGRRDLRNEMIVTIDGADAKDLDDAVSGFKRLDNGNYKLGVYIADVSYYVKENSAD